jgi:large subunit ribosomal protein L21
MQAVIKAGGKQYVVAPGEKVKIELVEESLDVNDQIELPAVAIIDGSEIIVDKSKLEVAKVTAKITNFTFGKKIKGFTYKNKTNQRRHWGHRQQYTEVEIGTIELG